MPPSSATPQVRIFSKDGELFLKAGDYREFNLTFKKQDDFEQADYSMLISFLRKDGLVTGLKITFQGTEALGTKE
jgi:hypothetical protein